MNHWMRQFHRWISIAFTVSVVVTFIALSTKNPELVWVSYVPLAPLGLLFLTGLYLFALPYLTRRRAGRSQPAGD
jgi:hypothetical protein